MVIASNRIQRMPTNVAKFMARGPTVFGNFERRVAGPLDADVGRVLTKRCGLMARRYPRPRYRDAYGVAKEKEEPPYETVAGSSAR